MKKIVVGTFLGIFCLILFMGVAQAACVAHWSLNDTDGLNNTCNPGTYDLTNSGATSGATGMFEEAYNFSTNDHMVASGGITLLTDFHFAVWAKPHALSGNTGIIGRTPDAADTNVEYYFHFSDEYLRLAVSNAVTIVACLDDTTPIPTGTWTHVAAAMNGTKMQLYVNATMVKSCDYAGVRQNEVHNTHIGKLGSVDNHYLNSALDEFWIYDEVLNSSTLTNLMHYNNLSGVPVVEPYITLNTPVDNDTDKNFTAGFTPVSLAGNEFINCTLFANETESGANSTDLTNNTINYITNDTLAGEGLYTWFIQCGLTNGTMINSQTNRTFTLDTTRPNVTINYPLNNSVLYVGDTPTLNATFTDNIDLFNCSYDIYLPNDTLWESDSIACSGTEFLWDNATTGGLPMSGTFRFNFSAMDSHTAREWKGKVLLDTVFNSLKIQDNKKFTTANITYKTNTTYEPLPPDKIGLPNKPTIKKVNIENKFDRQKITYEFNSPQKYFQETIKSIYPIYILEDRTGIPCHLVFGDQWYDCEAAVKEEGWKATVERISDNEVEITYSHATGYRQLDPATGGTNFGSAEVEVLVNGFSVDVYDERSQDAVTNWSMTITNSSGCSYSSGEQNNTWAWGNFSDVCTGSITIVISADGYVQRTYYGFYDLGSPITLDAFLLGSGDGIYPVFIVRDIQGDPIELADLTFQKLLSGVYTTIGQAQTDSSGTSQVFLDSTTSYRLTVAATGYNTYFTSSFTPVSTTYIITLTTNTSITYSNTSAILYAYIHPRDASVGNNTLIEFRCNDPWSNVQDFGMWIVNSTGDQIYSINSSASASCGIISLNISSIAGNLTAHERFTVHGYVYRSGTNHTFTRSYGLLGSWGAGLGRMLGIMSNVNPSFPWNFNYTGTALMSQNDLNVLAFVVLATITFSASLAFGWGAGIVSIAAGGFFVYFGWLSIPLYLLAVAGTIGAYASRRWM